MKDFYICPTCGNEVAVGSRGCAVCLKKDKKRKPRRKKRVVAKAEKRSWEQDDTYDGLDLPAEDFDYDAFCEREFGQGSAHKQVGIRWYWWLTAVVLLGVFVYVAGGYLLFLW